jgi:hypothetical protein
LFAGKKCTLMFSFITWVGSNMMGMGVPSPGQNVPVVCRSTIESNGVWFYDTTEKLFWLGNGTSTPSYFLSHAPFTGNGTAVVLASPGAEPVVRWNWDYHNNGPITPVNHPDYALNPAGHSFTSGNPIQLWQGASNYPMQLTVWYGSNNSDVPTDPYVWPCPILPGPSPSAGPCVPLP